MWQLVNIEPSASLSILGAYNQRHTYNYGCICILSCTFGQQIKIKHPQA